MRAAAGTTRVLTIGSRVWSNCTLTMSPPRLLPVSVSTVPSWATGSDGGEVVGRHPPARRHESLSRKGNGPSWVSTPRSSLPRRSTGSAAGAFSSLSIRRTVPMVGNRQRIRRLEEHRPQLGQLFERQRHRRELDLLDGIGQVRVRQKRRRRDGVLNHLPQQDGLRMKVANGGAQHPLRLELGFIPVEGAAGNEGRAPQSDGSSACRWPRAWEVVVSQRGVG